MIVPLGRISLTKVLLLLFLLIGFSGLVTANAFTPHGNSVDASVNSLSLIDASSNQSIAAFDPLIPNALIDLSLVGSSLNILANTDSSTNSVHFALNGPDGSREETENKAPFAFAGDSGGDFNVWTPAVGNYTITVTAYSEENRGGAASAPLTITFTVVDDGGANPATPTPPATSTQTPPTPMPNPGYGSGISVLEQDGIIVMEAENGTAQTDDRWDVESSITDYRGDGYIRWNGPNHFNDQSHGILTFPIKITRPGKYHMRLRSFHDPASEGETNDQQNDAWTSGDLNSGTLHKTFRSGSAAGQPWNFATEWEPNHGSFQKPTYDLTPGEYIFTLAARSQHYMIDRIYFYHNDYDESTALDHNRVESPRESTPAPTQPTAEPPATSEPVTRPSGEGNVNGTLIKWHPLTVSFDGPFATETDDSPNPFLDYRLQVTFTGPNGLSYTVPGFFAGDGNGSGTGATWQARFSPDQAGEWRYEASFRSGDDVAIDLSPNAGTPTSFDGMTGTLNIADVDTSAPGFLKWGRLDYVESHYLKFADGPYWLKGGVDSPENFFGYAGFDNTVDQGCKGIVHEYGPHFDDWQNGDPTWVSEFGDIDQGKGIIGALNYLSSQQINSIYFLPMNLGGDGCETYPFVNASGSFYDNTHYDISKLEQWRIVMEHAQQRGLALHFVLNETESNNERWLDDGSLGIERKLFYRELIARYGHLLAIKWNLSEENDYSDTELAAFADYISQLDWANHQIAVHTHVNAIGLYDSIRYNPNFDATSIQYQPDKAGEFVETMRAQTRETGRPWVIDMDENAPAGAGLNDGNASDLRKRVLYDVYFSGGNIEWYFGYHDLPLGGDMKTEDFRTREEMYGYMAHARRFMQENLPFWEMEPADDLLSGEDSSFGGGEVFAKAGEYYAIYLPEADNTSATLDLSSASGEFEKRWFNPRSGQFEGATETVSGGSTAELGAPPADADEDWVLFVKLTGVAVPTPEPTAQPTPIVTPTPEPTPGGTVTLPPSVNPVVYLPLVDGSDTVAE